VQTRVRSTLNVSRGGHSVNRSSLDGVPLPKIQPTRVLCLYWVSNQAYFLDLFLKLMGFGKQRDATLPCESELAERCARNLSQVSSERWILRRMIRPDLRLRDHRANRSEAFLLSGRANGDAELPATPLAKDASPHLCRRRAQRFNQCMLPKTTTPERQAVVSLASPTTVFPRESLIGHRSATWPLLPPSEMSTSEP
jgi:hypothetical protein